MIVSLATENCRKNVFSAIFGLHWALLSLELPRIYYKLYHILVKSVMD